jgi:hypothetical protein
MWIGFLVQTRSTLRVVAVCNDVERWFVSTATSSRPETGVDRRAAHVVAVGLRHSPTCKLIESFVVLYHLFQKIGSLCQDAALAQAAVTNLRDEVV